MEGGAIVGYCSTGSVKIDSAPATMIRIAMTIAKIGRSMKNFAIGRPCLSRRRGPREAFLERGTLRPWRDPSPPLAAEPGAAGACDATVRTSIPGCTF